MGRSGISERVECRSRVCESCMGWGPGDGWRGESVDGRKSEILAGPRKVRKGRVGGGLEAGMGEGRTMPRRVQSAARTDAMPRKTRRSWKRQFWLKRLRMGRLSLLRLGGEVDVLDTGFAQEEEQIGEFVEGESAIDEEDGIGLGEGCLLKVGVDARAEIVGLDADVVSVRVEEDEWAYEWGGCGWGWGSDDKEEVGVDGVWEGGRGEGGLDAWGDGLFGDGISEAEGEDEDIDPGEEDE